MTASKKQNKAKHIYLYTYIPIYFYPVNPVKKPNEANFQFLFRISSFKFRIFSMYPCILESLYSCILPNEPIFTFFHVLLHFSIYLFNFLPNEPNSCVGFRASDFPLVSLYTYILLDKHPAGQLFSILYHERQ